MSPCNDAPASLAAGPGRERLPERAADLILTQLGAARHSAVFRITLPSGATTCVAPTGRAGWLLQTLCEAGPEGLTATDLPAGLRLASYVHRLRRDVRQRLSEWPQLDPRVRGGGLLDHLPGRLRQL